MLQFYDEPARYIRAFFDGSCKDKGAAFGWKVFGADCLESDQLESWYPVAAKSGTLSGDASVTAAELEGISSLIGFLVAYYDNHDAACKALQSTSTMNYSTIRVLRLAGLV